MVVALSTEVGHAVRGPDPDRGAIKGGRRWRFSLGPGESQKLAFGYTVKIDSKNELVGGNRRE